jgi:hypothetical protein
MDYSCGRRRAGAGRMRHHGFRHEFRLFRFRHVVGHQLYVAQQQLRYFRFRQHVRFGQLRHLRLFLVVALLHRFVVYRHHWRR